MREAVFRKWGRRCLYPGCTNSLTEKNPLCVHDITDSNIHVNVAHMRPVCMCHHNQLTAAARSARSKIKRFREQGIQINTKQDLMFEEAFFG